MLLIELSGNVRIHLEESSSSSVETSCNYPQSAKELSNPSFVSRYAAADIAHCLSSCWPINFTQNCSFTGKKLAEVYPFEHGTDQSAETD